MQIILKLLAGSIFVQILMLMSLILSSRLYSPEKFGDLGWYMSVASIFAIISALRLDYIALRESIIDKRDFYKNTVFLNLIIIFLSGFFLMLISFLFNFNFSVFVLLFFLMGLSLFNSLSQYLVINKLYNRIVFFRVLLVVIQIILLLYYNYNYNENGLILSNLIPYCIIGFYFIIFFIRKNLIDFHTFFIFLKINFREGFNNTLLTFMQYSTPLVPVLFGTYFFDSKNIGAYFLISQVVVAPFSLIRRNLLIYFNGELNSPNNAKKIMSDFFSYKKLVILIFLIALSIFLVNILSEYLVLLVFGKEWVDFYWLLSLLFFYYLFDTIFQPFTTLLPLWGELKKSMYLEFSRFFLVFALLPLLAYVIKLSFIYFLCIYIFIMLFIYLINFIFVIFYMTKINQVENQV